MQFGDCDKELKRKEATEAYMALDDYFTGNRIFLSEKSGLAVEVLITAMRTSFNQFAMADRGRNEIDVKTWVDASNRMEKEAPALLAELRKEFRAALHIARRHRIDGSSRNCRPCSGTRGAPPSAASLIIAELNSPLR